METTIKTLSKFKEETKYFIRYNPTKKFVQMLYRLTQQDNGFISLQYHGEQGGWHYSFSYSEDVASFIASDLTKEISAAEMKTYL